MGVTDMFSEVEADFSRIPRKEANAPQLFVSMVKQKAILEVDEGGSDATSSAGNSITENQIYRAPMPLHEGRIHSKIYRA